MPILILHGTTEPAGGESANNHVALARDFETALRRHQKSVEASYYEGGGHNSFFINPAQRDDELKTTIEFLRRHLRRQFRHRSPSTIARFLAISGLKAYVHAPGIRQATEVQRAGADGLVHSVTDAPLDDELSTLMKKNGATYATTLSLYNAFSDVAAGSLNQVLLATSGCRRIRTLRRRKRLLVVRDGIRNWLNHGNCRIARTTLVGG